MKQKNISLFLIFFLFLLTISAFTNASASNVMIVEIDGTINQSTVELLKESIQHAENENSEIIILKLNTPGGGLQETFDIAKMINKSSIPIVGYVYPQGSAAWSAGTFILMSTHIACMANNTVIGSCQPVKVGPTGTELVEDSKTINALVSWIQTRARMYNRNQTTVARFITENLNLNASNAKKYGVIEFISPNINTLLKQINGTNISTIDKEIQLNTQNARKIYHQPSLKVIFLDIISNPLLTSLLFMIGIFAIIFGISSPGFGAEVFGVIAILLSLVGSGFSVPVLSIIFIIIGMLLLLIEILIIPGFGFVGIGGVISLAIGSIFLVPSYSTNRWVITMDWINDAIILVIAAVVIIAVFFLFLLYKILEIRTKKKALGVFIGETAVTLDKISPDKNGYVRFKGEYWQASADETIEENKKVLIVDKDGSILKVKSKNN